MSNGRRSATLPPQNSAYRSAEHTCSKVIFEVDDPATAVTAIVKLHCIFAPQRDSNFAFDRAYRAAHRILAFISNFELTDSAPVLRADGRKIVLLVLSELVKKMVCHQCIRC